MTGRHFLSHPNPLPSPAEIVGMLEALGRILRVMCPDVTMPELVNTKEIKLQRPRDFRRLLMSQCLECFETALNERLTVHPYADFDEEVDKFLCDKSFQQVTF